MKKSLTDVMKSQNDMLVILKRLEEHINNIHLRLDKIESTVIKSPYETNSLLHVMKDEVANNIRLIDKKIVVLSREIKKAEKNVDNASDAIPVRNTTANVNCNICEAVFSRYCDLEVHIESTHREYEGYDCIECGKKFVLKWRLEKHKNIHMNFNAIRQCKYFTNNIPCPYERFGCKFLHNFQTDESGKSFFDKSSIITSDAIAVKTSTPVKSILSKASVENILPCLGNCSDGGGQCTNCFVKEILENSKGEINMNDSCFD